MATAVSTVTPAPVRSQYEEHYDPTVILKHPEFAILPNDAVDLSDKSLNVACAYNEKHEVTMIKKPVPKAGKGECVVHVKATGICG
jgi:L-iditol 2-dehydrogenase